MEITVDATSSTGVATVSAIGPNTGNGSSQSDGLA
jgi:hypothetical protein